ncbi:keratin, type I cytoskeletal 23 isoform X2 [Hippopotamus amphibius kiboko]|uniref:keratin, type I cytoskeletal 23 isoform X2 n=1 Tax=Hippopotamus amphibius kiboko TaxID=575201 RepID=UPI002591E08D|nr:keratin, type I cytoskeletal 23 isoform X2 [Hippopotamus amphibius kiboko]
MNSSHCFSQTPSVSLCGTGGSWGRLGSFPRAPSVHGGAGGVRISLSFPSGRCPPPGGSWGSGRGSSLLGGNGKAMMQNLNDRLASYLDKVRALEEANVKLESCILKWHQQRDPGSKKDYSQYEENISHLREQIVDGKKTNAQTVLLLDNAKVAVDNFNLKYENEHSLKKDLEIEVEGLRKTLDDLTIVTTDLEQDVEGMRKELILMKKRHEQEMEGHHVPNDVKIDVKVDATPGEDLIKVLEDMRQEYEFIRKKKHQDLDAWYKEQSAAMAQEVASPAAVQNSQSDIHELKRIFQALEIDLQTQCNKKSALENMLSETQSQYSCQLQDMQRIISHYEEELMQLRHDLERQNSEYKVLLGIKTHLEKEIATYRQLLEGENGGTMEESKSSIKVPKIKAITQESVNGRIILSQVNEI